MLGFGIKKDTMLSHESFNIATRIITRTDSGLGRWTKGLIKRPLVNVFNVLFAIGAIVTAVLRIYSAIISFFTSFAKLTVAISFGCTSLVSV